MEQRTDWMLIGPGNIGREIQRQVGQEYVAERLNLNRLPSFVVNSSIVRHDLEDLPKVEHISDIPNNIFPEVTFIATSTTDDGEAAKGYIDDVLERGKIAVTAEKGALANNFGELKGKSNDFESLGVNATVGGGTRMLDVANNFMTDVENFTQMHLVLNGTFSSIFSSIAPPSGSGMSLGSAVHHAVELGFAEPGAETPLDVIRGEAEGDIPKKTAILFNKLGLSEELIDWRNLKFELTDDEINEAIEEAKVRRFIVSIYSSGFLDKNEKRCPERDVIGGFNKDHAGFRIVGGFRNIERNPLFDDLSKLTGPGNGLVVGLGPDETDGVYKFSGPGAGVRPTVNTMLDDYINRAHLIN